MGFIDAEDRMWRARRTAKVGNTTDEDINEKYIRGEQRIVTESNREKLPIFVRSLDDKNLIEMSPFYQRRKRWDRERQSKLIESFIMNVPVPPVFLYEKDYGQYEVMDGQQRITAVKEFYNNEFALEGLQQWPELNGRRYHDLPGKVKAGIDRRSISSIILLKESAQSEAGEEAELFVRQTVFERLNTGGIKLEAQEIRNALYPGRFNETLNQCSRNPFFREAWGLPAYTEREERGTAKIHKFDMYKKMEDLELVLRFFALRHVEHYRGGMKTFLSLYMNRAIPFDESANQKLTGIFSEIISSAVRIYGNKTFRYYAHKKNQWVTKPRKAIYDGVMVGLCKNSNKLNKLVLERDKVIERTQQLFAHAEEGTFTGRGNSKKDIERRIDLFAEMYRSI